jgi:adenylate cyclase
MSQPEAFLLIAAPQGEREFPLGTQGSWTIGRNPDHPIVLSDESVSRTHALLQQTRPGEFCLIDMGSRNGSFVNGARVSVPRLLNDGDQIAMGDVTLTFHCGAAAANHAVPPGEARVLEQTRAVYATAMITVLVVDIRDFTKLAQRVDPGVLSKAIGTWFSLAGGVIQGCGSWTQKYIGDAIMSVWLHRGEAPQSKEVLDILKAYLEVAAITSTVGAQFSFPWRLRVGGGVNTGVASVGNIGSTGVNDFTALGDPVNAAFRIEGATRLVEADLAIGQNTHKMLRALGEVEACFRPHTLQLKGYEQPSTVWCADLDSVRRFVASAVLPTAG